MTNTLFRLAFAALLPLAGLPAARAHEDSQPAASASPAAAAYACPMHQEVTDTKPGATCPKCGMKLVAKAAPQPDAMAQDHAHGGMDMAMPPAAAVPTIKTEILARGPLAAGKHTPAVAKLTRPDGTPLTFAGLSVAHTKRIHLLVIDESLTDYSHEHPEETATPGEFAFDFHPKHGGRYTVWADIVPTATGQQEYSRAEITVPGTPAPMQPTVNTTATVGGYRFDLATENNQPLRVGEATLVTVRVTGPDGKPAADLEPLMGAFAHGVAFPADLSGVSHVHPMGREPEKNTERGGPELSFHLLPERAGYLKFYVQVQIGGEDHDLYAGFGLNVEQPAAVTMKH